MFKFMNWQDRRVLAPEDGDGGNGAGNGKPDPVKELADLKAKYEAADKELQALKAKPAPPPADDLAATVAKEREAKAKKDSDSKSLSDAIRFNMAASDFMKNNAALLPESIAGLFAQSDKKVYGSDIEKANDIKVGIVSEYFAVKENLDQLTDSQKTKC